MKRKSLRGQLRAELVSQFHRPHGVLGRLAGGILANRPSNRKRNLWTIELLDIQPMDRVLELGCGPGFAIEAASRFANAGLVVGIDHSELMCRTALRRNSVGVRAGHVDVVRASFSDLPDFDEPFDKVFGVNALQFSENPEAVIGSIAKRLRTGGLFATTLQSRKPAATDDDSRRGGEARAGILERLGFHDVRIEVLPLEPVCVCVLGRAGAWSTILPTPGRYRGGCGTGVIR